MYNEQELLLAVSRGNEQAFRQLILQYSALLHSFIYRHTESRELAEEIVQDIFIQLWLTRESLEQVRNFHTYLFVLSRNRTINEMKKLLREKKRLHRWQEENTPPTDPHETIDLKTYVDLVDEAVEQLAPQQKKVWIMSRRDGFTYQQIADELQISRETVKSYLKAANTGIIRYLTPRTEYLLLFLFLK